MKHVRQHLLVALATLGFALAASAQISTINSVVYDPRYFNDIPGATLTVVSNYPSLISFDYQNVSTTNARSPIGVCGISPMMVE